MTSCNAMTFKKVTIMEGIITMGQGETTMKEELLPCIAALIASVMYIINYI